MPSNWFSSFWSSSEEKSESFRETGKFLEGLQVGKESQWRFKILDSFRLNDETVAGIKDMSLRKTGKPILRFDTGDVSGKGAHIDFDPRGYPNRRAPPMDVSESVVNLAYYGGKALEVAGTVITVAGYGVDVLRLIMAAQKDLDSYANINQTPPSHYPEVFGDYDDDSRACYQHFKKLKLESDGWFFPRCFASEAGSIVGGRTAGYVGGSTGSYAGTVLGGAFGGVLGAPGALVGSVIGAYVGATYGAVAATNSGSKKAEELMGKVGSWKIW